MSKTQLYIYGVLVLLMYVVPILVLIYMIVKNRSRADDLFKERLDAEMALSKARHESYSEFQEEIYRKLSSEIHDNLGQLVFLTKLEVNAAMEQRDWDLVRSALERIDYILFEVKVLTFGYDPSITNWVGLRKSIQREIDFLNKLGQFKIESELNLYEEIDMKGNELVFFRMFQEALHNAVRHSKAHLIRISARSLNRTFEFSIEDDGLGFDVNRIGPDSNGIRNLQKRAEVLGAALEINSTIGGGTRLFINYSGNAKN